MPPTPNEIAALIGTKLALAQSLTAALKRLLDVTRLQTAALEDRNLDRYTDLVFDGRQADDDIRNIQARISLLTDAWQAAEPFVSDEAFCEVVRHGLDQSSILCGIGGAQRRHTALLAALPAARPAAEPQKEVLIA